VLDSDADHSVDAGVCALVGAEAHCMLGLQHVQRKRIGLGENHYWHQASAWQERDTRRAISPRLAINTRRAPAAQGGACGRAAAAPGLLDLTLSVSRCHPLRKCVTATSIFWVSCSVKRKHQLCTAAASVGANCMAQCVGTATCEPPLAVWCAL